MQLLHPEHCCAGIDSHSRKFLAGVAKKVHWLFSSLVCRDCFCSRGHYTASTLRFVGHTWQHPTAASVGFPYIAYSHCSWDPQEHVCTKHPVDNLSTNTSGTKRKGQLKYFSVFSSTVCPDQDSGQ